LIFPYIDYSISVSKAEDNDIDKYELKASLKACQSPTLSLLAMEEGDKQIFRLKEGCIIPNIKIKVKVTNDVNDEKGNNNFVYDKIELRMRELFNNEILKGKLCKEEPLATFYTLINLKNITPDLVLSSINQEPILGINFKTCLNFYLVINENFNNSDNRHTHIKDISNSINILLEEMSVDFENINYLIIRPDHIIEKIKYKLH